MRQVFGLDGMHCAVAQMSNCVGAGDVGQVYRYGSDCSGGFGIPGPKARPRALGKSARVAGNVVLKVSSKFESRGRESVLA